jgi:hypothetical protein
MLPLKLKNQELFELSDPNNIKSYELFGLVCYWGSHYICFFKSDSSDTQWVSYDDTIVIKVPSWKDLIVKCLKSHFHPTILFYKKSDSSNYSDLAALKETLTDEDINKLMDYSRKFDIESQKPYKSDELENNRLRPTSYDKKKTQIDLYDLSNRPKGNFENEEWDFKNHIDPSITSNSKLSENKKDFSNITNYSNAKHIESSKQHISDHKLYKNSADLVPPIKDDEWICGNSICKNVNKNTDYQCLSKIL